MLLLTKRLRIRALRLDHDSQYLLRLYEDPLAMKFMGGEVMTDVKQVEAFLIRRLKYSAGAPLGFWAVDELDSEEVIGTALLDHPPLSSIREEPMFFSKDVQLGGALRRDRWRYGYGFELGQALLNYAFDRCGLTSIIAMAEPKHVVSLNLMSQLRFKEEGITRDYYGGLEMIRHRATASS